MLVRQLFRAFQRALPCTFQERIHISVERPLVASTKIFYHRSYSSTPGLRYQHDVADLPNPSSSESKSVPGSQAFVDCELYALVDLFDKYAFMQPSDDTVASLSSNKFINRDGLKRLLHAVGESPTEDMLEKLFEEADADGNGVIDLDVSDVDDNSSRIRKGWIDALLISLSPYR
jgi:hypothetical protein